GIVHAWQCLDKNGQLNDVLLGRPDLEGYIEDHPFFNAIIGRSANRIAFGRFELDGHQYQLPINLPPHHLHGGFNGLDKSIWSGNFTEKENCCELVLYTTLTHLEDGYPGNMDVWATYTYTDKNELTIAYRAQSDRPTLFNPTLHLYFNLSGLSASTILDHQLWLHASHITEIDETSIPTGHYLPVQKTPLDFLQSRYIGENLDIQHPLFLHTKGYDHNFVLDNHAFDEPVASVIHPESGRQLQVYTDRPGLQLYAGNWLENIRGKAGFYRDYSGICLETQGFPDAPNHPHFPQFVLRPGAIFESKTKYKVSIEPITNEDKTFS
ncbi:MAG: galactose mutarotase, partial [Flavobacteriales bacterium]|nr:galactose mutarotase [Flavobacteriales bacterium]